MRAIELIRFNLSRVLREKGVRQSRLAEALDNAPSHVSQIMTGKRWNKRIEWTTYKKICDALDIDELELIKPQTCDNDVLVNRLSKGVENLNEADDVALVFQFLAILKFKKILNSNHYKVLTGALSMLEEELGRKMGVEAFSLPDVQQKHAGEEALPATPD